MIRYLLLAPIVCTSLVSCVSAPTHNAERDRTLIQGRLEALESQQDAQRSKIRNLEEAVKRLEDRLALMQRLPLGSTEREVVRIEPTNPNNAVLSSQFQYDTSDKDEVYTEIVISDEKKRAYFGSSTKQSTNSTATRKPYDNVVTGDKLPAGSGQTPKAPKTTLANNNDAAQYYKEGIDLYRRGLFDDGRIKFEAFLQTKPDREYTDNALYWIGECYYGVGQYTEAASYFQRIVKDYPETNKVPDALLKISLTYQKLGKPDLAREMLQLLLSSYPQSDAARVAKEKYESLF